jgi:hypothetical protein
MRELAAGLASWLAERVNNETTNSDADTGVSYVKSRPGMGQGKVQVEKQKVDDMTVPETISQVPQNPREQKPQSYPTPRIGKVTAREKEENNGERDNRKHDEEPVVVGEGTESRS